MAALTSSNVRLIKSWVEGEVNSKRRKVRQVEVHGGSWGGTTNTMPASAFGLSVIEEVSSSNYGDKCYPAVPKTDSLVVYAYNGAGSGTSPGDITVGATPLGMFFTVKGY